MTDGTYIPHISSAIRLRVPTLVFLPGRNGSGLGTADAITLLWEHRGARPANETRPSADAALHVCPISSSVWDLFLISHQTENLISEVSRMNK